MIHESSCDGGHRKGIVGIRASRWMHWCGNIRRDEKAVDSFRFLGPVTAEPQYAVPAILGAPNSLKKQRIRTTIASTAKIHIRAVTS